MLNHYGPLLPLRVLEEIRHWKQQESWHVDVIQSASIGLEPGYVQLLNDWRKVFDETERTALDLLELERIQTEVPAASQESPVGPSVSEQIDNLLQVSSRQSQEYVRQLNLLIEQSGAVRGQPTAANVLLHAAHESQYFLISTNSYQPPGSIAHAAVQDGTVEDQKVDIRRGEQATIHGKTVGEPNKQEPSSTWKPVPIGGHKLPPLPYAYNALEPYIDEKTMRIHHDKHHQSYVDDLNKAEKKLAEARKTGNFDLVKNWERELAFNGAGHYLHTIFWTIMSPNGGGKPTGALADQIQKDFGSFEAFKAQFSAAAEKVEGGGWAILIWSPRAGRLEILQAEKHQNLSQWDNIPLLTLDVWEHAYYLKHQNERNKYIEDWWNVVNWPEVAERYAQASKLRWAPF